MTVNISYSEERPIVSVEYGGIVFDNKGHEETGRFRIAVGSSDFGTFTKESAIEFLEVALRIVEQ